MVRGRETKCTPSLDACVGCSADGTVWQCFHAVYFGMHTWHVAHVAHIRYGACVVATVTKHGHSMGLLVVLAVHMCDVRRVMTA
jgi:hypothetical protein